MIPRPDECNWTDDRPLSQWERSILLALANAHRRLDNMGVPAADHCVPDTAAHRMLVAS